MLCVVVVVPAGGGIDQKTRKTMTSPLIRIISDPVFMRASPLDCINYFVLL